jgi:alpha-galactosidase
VITLALVGGSLQPAPCTAAGAEDVMVARQPGGPIVLRTPTSEFVLLPSGEIQAALLVEGRRLTLHEPVGPGPSVDIAGARMGAFTLNLAGATIGAVQGKLGAGKRVEVRGRSAGPVAVERSVVVEVYADFPGLALSTSTYHNVGTRAITLERVAEQRHRLSAALADPKAAPYEVWSFQGASTDWGQDDVLPLAKGFSRANVMGTQNPNGLGGGVPVNAFWTASVGEAIGHLDPMPLVTSMPVKVEADGRVVTSLSVEPRHTLKPGEAYTAPRSFLAVYRGDYYAPLRLYAEAREREGWAIPRPTEEDYKPAWCGWGYEFDVTPAQMLGTIPMLKELGVEWATLDDRWFANYGDWLPRPDTFPGDSIKEMVSAFHREGIRVQIWWLPLGVEDGEKKYESHPYTVSRVASEHPDWLILDKDGKHARMVRNLAALCPALPEVREYHRKLTETFIRDWGFDGHKLDNVYTVPPCYNPAHHHRSPEESIQAFGEVYKTIFDTTRSLKPDSVTQICPCGTPPSPSFLPYMDQAVTADPVGARQVRTRIKMYKALLGPTAAVYGDHVELSEMKRLDGDNWTEMGKDFASTVGTGGVVGTKFAWPDYGPKFKAVFLDEEKVAHWKKWIGIYNAKMLSRGTFLGLYVHGYDVPEGYAIAKDDGMYYAFFAADPSTPWKGRLELRGLKPGRYKVRDYAEGTDLGSVDASDPFLTTGFTHHLLLEVVPVT